MNSVSAISLVTSPKLSTFHLALHSWLSHASSLSQSHGRLCHRGSWRRVASIWLDNLVFLGSVTLYTELMIFDHLQSYYRKMEADLNGSNECYQSVTTDGSGSGSGSGTNRGVSLSRLHIIEKHHKKRGDILDHLTSNDGSGSSSGSGSGTETACVSDVGEENLQLKGLELQYDALAHEIELLTMKADAIRATKAAWLLSAAISAAIGVVMVTTGAAAVSAGAAAGAIIGGELGYWSVSRPVGQAFGAVIGAEYGADVVEPMHSQTGDVCAPMFW